MVVFNYNSGATVLTFTRDPMMGGYETIRQWKNPSIRGCDGKTTVYHKSIVHDIVTLTWPAIDKTDLINLLAFLVTVNGSGNKFLFVDPRGGCYTAYFWGPDRLLWTPNDLMQEDFTIELLITEYIKDQITALVSYYLTDESGNYLTDESGNRLTALQ
jgi:hypothetical protein